jgi:hypothetical protein
MKASLVTSAGCPAWAQSRLELLAVCRQVVTSRSLLARGGPDRRRRDRNPPSPSGSTLRNGPRSIRRPPDPPGFGEMDRSCHPRQLDRPDLDKAHVEE